jgi:N-acetylglutamate synthase-like GNAT family acetyltransferase
VIGPVRAAAANRGKQAGPKQVWRTSLQGGVKARQARWADAAAIYQLIAHYAAEGLLLPRTEKEISIHIGRFLVLEEAGKIVGCASLETYGPGLAEIRSLAVDPEARGHGLGARLLAYVLQVAKRRKIPRVFAVTHAPEFFGRQGFLTASRWDLPEKISRDCCTCPKCPTCKLVAVVATICPESVTFPALAARRGGLATSP